MQKEFNFKYSVRKNERVVKLEDITPFIKDIKIGERVVLNTQFGDTTVKVVSKRDYEIYQ